MIPIARPILGEEEVAAVKEVLGSGMLAQGPKVKAFEAAFDLPEGSGPRLDLARTADQELKIGKENAEDYPAAQPFITEGSVVTLHIIQTGGAEDITCELELDSLDDDEGESEE